MEKIETWKVARKRRTYEAATEEWQRQALIAEKLLKAFHDNGQWPSDWVKFVMAKAAYQVAEEQWKAAWTEYRKAQAAA